MTDDHGVEMPTIYDGGHPATGREGLQESAGLDSLRPIGDAAMLPSPITGESEAKAPETADQPVESAARRQPGTKYEAVAQASQVAHHYIVPPPRDLSLIRFALHGLMERAYWLANAAAQDKPGGSK